MKLRVQLAGAAALLFTVACSSEPRESSDAATWVGTITTEGTVTTVINEAGSVWGGMATLVEEASIGVETGAPEYMFGWVSGLAATEERIYVIARDATVIRVYDFSGEHLYDMGGRGQGPGEFTHPSGLWVSPDKRILVQDGSLQRLNVYSGGGESLDTWRLGLPDLLNQPWQAAVGDDGRFYTTGRRRDPDSGRRLLEMVAYGPDGSTTQVGPILPPAVPDQAVDGLSLPYAVAVVSSVLPSKALLVGTSDAYRFKVRYPDGRVTVIEKGYEPVPVAREERDWHRARMTAVKRRRDPDWRWSGPDIPEYKPAYRLVHPDASGRLWVLRDARSLAVAGCDENPAAVENVLRVKPCWRSPFYADVFEEGGRFLGSVPDFINGYLASTISFAPPRLFIHGDMVLARVEDEAGTIMVKRYRLVLPGER